MADTTQQHPAGRMRSRPWFIKSLLPACVNLAVIAALAFVALAVISPGQAAKVESAIFRSTADGNEFGLVCSTWPYRCLKHRVTDLKEAIGQAQPLLDKSEREVERLRSRVSVLRDEQDDFRRAADRIDAALEAASSSDDIVLGGRSLARFQAAELRKEALTGASAIDGEIEALELGISHLNAILPEAQMTLARNRGRAEAIPALIQAIELDRELGQGDEAFALAEALVREVTAETIVVESVGESLGSKRLLRELGAEEVVAPIAVEAPGL
ncbi:MAG: hypothetical protein NXH97_22750 [Rhodobacteraceae bacterium]|nr:hypothetical protein [Paracoccaceae bacterium]